MKKFTLLLVVLGLACVGCQHMAGLGALKAVEDVVQIIRGPTAAATSASTPALATVEDTAKAATEAAEASQKTLTETQRVAAEVVTALGKAQDAVGRIEDATPHIANAIESAKQGDYLRTIVEIAAALGLGGGGLKLGQKLERKKATNGGTPA